MTNDKKQEFLLKLEKEEAYILFNECLYNEDIFEGNREFKKEIVQNLLDKMKQLEKDYKEQDLDFL